MRATRSRAAHISLTSIAESTTDALVGERSALRDWRDALDRCAR
jgi:hypothetical protein